jgi:hypothetical protein
VLCALCAFRTRQVTQKDGDYGFMARKLRVGLAEITASLTEGFVTQMTQIAQIFYGSQMAQKTQI